MALDTTGLESDLEALFVNPSIDATTLAGQWADTMEDYTTGVVPTSTTVTAAAATLKTALTPLFGSTAPAAAAMDTAFQAFAVTVGVGMLPAFVATPPPLPPGFVAGLLPPFPATHATAAAKWKTIIDNWMRTGTAVPSGGGPSVPWS